MKLVVGNWKANGSRAALKELSAAMAADPPACEAVVCPPLPLLGTAPSLNATTPLRWGAQDCSEHDGGAYTGEVPAHMIRELGARHVIIGHSERRRLHRETDAQVLNKVRCVLAAGMTPILCVGESAEERDANLTKTVLRGQLIQLLRAIGDEVRSIVLAYEPRWAVGSGHAAAPGLIDEAMDVLREVLLFHGSRRAGAVRLLYGGSVTADNAGAILARPSVGGVLVGRASLKLDQFMAICRSAAQRA
jgi:triosephosphate isomerase